MQWRKEEKGVREEKGRKNKEEKDGPEGRRKEYQ
jgi:hypothetical protein